MRDADYATLKVSGAKQVGKTYIVNRFADEQYQKKIYINLLDLSGELFLEQYWELWQEMKAGKKYENPVHELIKRYQPEFEDSEETVIYIDEKEEKGFDEDSFSEELQSIVVRDYSSNISKVSVNRAIDWLYSSGIIGFANKLTECNILDFKAKARCYFMDVGLAYYFLTKTGCAGSIRKGIVNENFVYLDLRRRITHPSEIALETPAFATLGNGEIDFFVKALRSEETYAVEVKSGKNSGRTAAEALDKKKADYILYAKRNIHGGKTENIITIPVYGIAKYQF